MSPKEFGRTDACVTRLDRDEDERISLAELAPDRSLFSRRFPDVDGSDVEDYIPVAPLTSDDDRERAARRILARFGRGGGVALDRLSAGGPGRNGVLDPAGLRQLLKNPVPDVEAVVTLTASAKLVQVPPPPGISAMPVVTRSVDGQNLVAAFEDFEIELHVADSAGFIGHSIPREFRKADRDKSRTIDRKEAQSNNLFRHLFRVADRDGNGQLTEAEVDSYAECTRDAMYGRTRVLVNDRGSALHHRIDVNHDGELSVRELREAGRSLSPLDRDRDGQIAMAEVPRRYEVFVGRGFGIIQGFAIGPQVPAARGVRRAAAPHWFSGMDRNGDGDISPREFHGPDAVFRTLDINGDCLLDAVEAAGAVELFPPLRNWRSSQPGLKSASP